MGSAQHCEEDGIGLCHSNATIFRAAQRYAARHEMPCSCYATGIFSMPPQPSNSMPNHMPVGSIFITTPMPTNPRRHMYSCWFCIGGIESGCIAATCNANNGLYIRLLCSGIARCCRQCHRAARHWRHHRVYIAGLDYKPAKMLIFTFLPSFNNCHDRLIFFIKDCRLYPSNG